MLATRVAHEGIDGVGIADSCKKIEGHTVKLMEILVGCREGEKIKIKPLFSFDSSESISFSAPK